MDGQALRFEKIVCGVDESDVAREAARVAAELSLELDLPLMLVHVVPPPPPAAPGLAPRAYAYVGDYDTAVEAGRTLLEQVASTLVREHVDQKVVIGDASQRLREIAEEERASLLVVGSRGRGVVAAAVLGSVSSALAGDAPCPVLVVPSGTTANGR